ncbi:MAG: anthranilate phosphoribosyltransferase [Blastocatellia bacterium]
MSDTLTPLPALLEKLKTSQNLSMAEAGELSRLLLGAEISDEQITDVLRLLASKGETEDEIAGFAATMREFSEKVVSTRHTSIVDTCGTGGSAAKTFNVSTAAAFVVAAAGIPVAKHGNVGVTSKSGSADVLRELGVNIDLSPAQARECLDQVGICFMFAPRHHPATRRVAQARRALGFRTIFNYLGPLTNPAGVPFQVIGVSDPKMAEKVALALARLGTRRAWVVHGLDGLDEITLADATLVHDVRGDGTVKQFEISPDDFGIGYADLDKARGGTASENAETVRGVLKGEIRDEARNLVLLNAAAAFCVAGACVTPQGAVEQAAHAIDSGAALTKLEEFRDYTQTA